MMRKFKRNYPVKVNCIFCKKDSNPDYKDVEGLQKYVSERGRIIGKARTGLCAKHQRRAAMSIKQARYIGLIPFIVRPR